jgi:flagellar basal-body rod protein FlgF
MDRLVHISTSALRGAMARQAATANNLANASTVGFKGEMANVRPLWLQGEGLGSRAVASEEVLAADMTGGAITATGRGLDIAMRGDALLGVQSKDGSEAYTRRGDLQMTDSGLLTTGDGLPVLGDGGPITLPPNDRVEIDEAGAVWIMPAGADPNLPLQRIDQLKLASPAGSRIHKQLDGLFRADGGATLPSDPTARVAPASLEGSNVNTSQALIDMIEASRDWETQIKLVNSVKELDTSTGDLMRIE